ncbi:MAG: hypothetical protein WC627_05595 [Legionella sp.]|jgi:ElaB/YqjD/DUF883 family membrane-anchored ribosome-binding protein
MTGLHGKASGESRIKGSANELLRDSQKLANDIYEEGMSKVSKKVNEVEDVVQDYSDVLIKKIHANPISSVLVAVGVGFLISSIFKK